MSKKYLVSVSRVIVETTDVEIEAETEVQAELKALGVATTLKYYVDSTDYEVDDVEELDD